MELHIAHLYPDLLNLYGDRGNIICLQKRCEWRGIQAEVKEYNLNDTLKLDEVDILFLGGGSDREQKIVAEHLQYYKEDFHDYVEKDGVLVAICGGYQFLGQYYQLGNERVEGLSLLAMFTVSEETRLIGNVVIENEEKETIVGFENHGGRTYIGDHQSLGKVVRGSGNNGKDDTEGVIYKNVIGTYLHGPLLPKNPKLADDIIKRALQRKYGKDVTLSALEDGAENRAHSECLRIVKA